MNKLKIILGACGIHICVGSVYAWSVLCNPIIQRTGWGLSEVTFAFSLAILFLGFSAGFLGNKVQRWGASNSALISCVCFNTGLLGSALAISVQNLYLLYFFYGCIGGIGLGVGYIAPVSTLLKAFPRAKGFAGGCAVMSFGFAAMIAGPLMERLINHIGLIYMFIALAAIYSSIMIISSFLLRVNPQLKERDKFNTIYGENSTFMPIAGKLGKTADEAIHTIDFWLLWFVFFINISCGIALLSIAAPMGQSIGMNAVEAAGMVGLFGMLNGAGRIFYASVSDYIGRGITYIAFFIIEVISFYLLAHTSNILFFQSIVLVIVTCYGGGFSCMPSYLSDIFGLKYLSAIHGRILTAWGLAGIFGPLMLTVLYERFGTYELALEIFSGLFIINLICAIALYKRNRV